MAELGPIDPEFGARPEDLQALNEVMVAIEEHNAQFTPYAMIGRVFDLEAEIDQAVLDPKADSQGELPLSAWAQESNRPLLHEEQGMGRGVLGATNMGVLESSGLGLGEPRATVIVQVRGRSETAGPIRVQLADGSVFCDFLERAATQPKPVKTVFRGMIYAVAASIFFELSDHFGLGTENPGAAATMAYSGSIADKLVAFDKDIDPELVQYFRECQEHTTTGTVREWIIADRLALFDAPEDHDPTLSVRPPGVLHRYVNASEAAHVWDHVLFLLEDAMQIETGQSFYMRLLQAARANLEFAEQDWNTRQDDQENGEEFSVLFAAVRDHLRRLGAYPDAE